MDNFQCRICGKELVSRGQLTATDLLNPNKMVYHETFGALCLSHKGVREMFEELSEQALPDNTMSD